MMIQVPIQVPMWRCSDGKVCESAEEAREHERWLAWLALCREFSIDSYDAKQMWERRSEFCELADGQPGLSDENERDATARALRLDIADIKALEPSVNGAARTADRMMSALDDLIGDLGKPA